MIPLLKFNMILVNFSFFSGSSLTEIKLCQQAIGYMYKQVSTINCLSYVGSTLLYVGLKCENVCLFQMVATEVINSVSHKPPLMFKGYAIPAWVWESYSVIGVFAFGAACSQLTTDVLKYTIGRLRPHFFTVCRPNCTINQYEFITNFTCTNPDFINNARIMKEMRSVSQCPFLFVFCVFVKQVLCTFRLSFPSGHSSFSMYTALYFAVST